MKYVNIDSEELKAKTYYFFISIFFTISIISYLSIVLFGLSGIIKWMLYLISIFFVFTGILFCTKDISYCKVCDLAYDFNVVKCPHCGNKLELKSKSNIEYLRKKSAQTNQTTIKEKNTMVKPSIQTLEDKKDKKRTNEKWKKDPELQELKPRLPAVKKYE